MRLPHARTTINVRFESPYGVLCGIASHGGFEAGALRKEIASGLRMGMPRSQNIQNEENLQARDNARA
jgi:hypothetical protein